VPRKFIFVGVLFISSLVLGDRSNYRQYSPGWIPMAPGTCVAYAEATAKRFEAAGAEIIDQACSKYQNGLGSILVSYRSQVPIPITSAYVGRGFVTSLIDFQSVAAEDLSREWFESGKGEGAFPSYQACAAASTNWANAFRATTELPILSLSCQQQFSKGVAMRIDALGVSTQKFNVMEGSFGQAEISAHFLGQLRSYFENAPDKSLWFSTNSNWMTSVAYWSKTPLRWYPLATRYGNTHGNRGECRLEIQRAAKWITGLGDKIVALDCLGTRDVEGRPYFLSALIYEPKPEVGARPSLEQGPKFSTYAACSAYREKGLGSNENAESELLCIADRGFVSSPSYHLYFLKKGPPPILPPPEGTR